MYLHFRRVCNIKLCAGWTTSVLLPWKRRGVDQGPSPYEPERKPKILNKNPKQERFCAFSDQRQPEHLRPWSKWRFRRHAKSQVLTNLRVSYRRGLM